MLTRRAKAYSSSG